MREEQCSCGRTSYRLTGISGRVGEATKVRGMFIAPSQLRRVAARFGDVRLQALVDRVGFKDRLTVKVEVPDGNDQKRFLREFGDYLKEVCTVKADELSPVDKGAIGQDAALIVDRRDWK